MIKWIAASSKDYWEAYKGGIRVAIIKKMYNPFAYKRYQYFYLLMTKKQNVISFNRQEMITRVHKENP